MTIEDYIKTIENDEARELATLYMPVISRMVASVGWDVVRRWIYTDTVDAYWYEMLVDRMTTAEHRAEDERRLKSLCTMSSQNAALIKRERAIIQALLTTLITQLIGKL